MRATYLISGEVYPVQIKATERDGMDIDGAAEGLDDDADDEDEDGEDELVRRPISSPTTILIARPIFPYSFASLICVNIYNSYLCTPADPLRDVGLISRIRAIKLRGRRSL